jgi:hypothetical protein
MEEYFNDARSHERQIPQSVLRLGCGLNVRGNVVRLPTAARNCSLTYSVKSSSDSSQPPNHRVQGVPSLRDKAAKALS